MDRCSQNRGTAVYKVLLVLIRVEPDDVAREHGLHDLLAHRQGAPEVRSREGRVQREADGAALALLRQLLAEQLGQQHQVVIVHPDEVPVVGGVRDLVGN